MKRTLILGACLAAGIAVLGVPDSPIHRIDARSVYSEGRTIQPHPWCVRADTGAPGELLLTPDSLGPVTPTMSRRDLAVRCPGLRDTVSYGYTGVPRPVTILVLARRHIGVIEWHSSKERLSRVVVLSDAVRALGRVGIGSSMRELRAQLGPLRAAGDEGGVFVWSETLPHISFLMAVRLPDSVNVEAESIDPAVIPDSGRVREVLFGPW